MFVVICCFDFDLEIVNCDGGVIVFGYLLGLSGCCIVVILFGWMEWEDVEFGFVMMCVGVG